MKANEKSTTTLVATKALRRQVITFIKQNGYITNRQCRDLLEIGYDQVISLFNQMLEAGELKREGKTSGIKYVLP